MFEQSVETSGSPHVIVTEALRDLIVRASDEERVSLRLRGSGEHATLEQDEDKVTVSVHTDCFLTCPTDTTLTIKSVQGTLKVRGIQGAVTVEQIYGEGSFDFTGPTKVEKVFGNFDAHDVVGDLDVKTVLGNARVRRIDGETSLESVSGNLRAGGLGGAVSLQEIGGNCRIRDVESPLFLGRLSGNLRASGLVGGLEAEKIGGSVRLGPPFSVGTSYRLTSDGNLRVFVPVNGSLDISIRASGRIHSRVPGLEYEGEGGEMKGVLGGGEAALEANVGGNITLRPVDSGEETGEEFELEIAADLEGLGAAIEARIAEAMTEVETRLDESLGRIDSDRIRRRVEHATDQALRATERAAERARHEAERAAERARLRAERAERRWQRVSGKPKPKSRPKISDDERLRVLKMVEEGKITPEQAAELLAALEGR
jgi:DUF4097 and DUF4098 domain-containing protein YvlB